MSQHHTTQFDGILSVADDNFMFDQSQGGSCETGGAPSFHFSSAGDTATHSGHTLIDVQGSDAPGGGHFGAIHVQIADTAPIAEFAHAPAAADWLHAEQLSGLAADAKSSAGGGKPSGGGGGGGGLLTTYTSGSPTVDNANEFNIQINFSGTWTAKQQAVVEWAADFWSNVITRDVHDDKDLNGNLADDIVISVSTGRIDGTGNPLTGNVLAQTSNIVVRDPGAIDQWLPLTASIKVDSTDLKSTSLSGSWDSIILHEMGHALGFVGAIFSQLGLLDSAGNFDGANAVNAYNNGSSVPLETVGGAGTAGSHWIEAFAPNGVQMSNELMTGFFVPGETTLLSDTTVAALADLGYQVQDPSIGSFLTVDSHVLV